MSDRISKPFADTLTRSSTSGASVPVGTVTGWGNGKIIDGTKQFNYGQPGDEGDKIPVAGPVIPYLVTSPATEGGMSMTDWFYANRDTLVTEHKNQWIAKSAGKEPIFAKTLEELDAKIEDTGLASPFITKIREKYDPNKAYY